MRPSKRPNAVEIIVGHDPFPSETDMLREGTLHGLVVEASKQEEALAKVAEAVGQADAVFRAINKAMKEMGANQFELQEDFLKILNASHDMGSFWTRLNNWFKIKNDSSTVVKKAAGLALTLEGLRKTLINVLEQGDEADVNSVKRQLGILETNLKSLGINRKDYTKFDEKLEDNFGVGGSPSAADSVLGVIKVAANASKVQKAISILSSVQVNTSGVTTSATSAATGGRGGRGGSVEVGGGYGFTGIGGSGGGGRGGYDGDGGGRTGGGGRGGWSGGGDYEPGPGGGRGGRSGGSGRRSQPSEFALDTDVLKARLVDKAGMEEDTAEEFVEEIVDIVDDAFRSQTGREDSKLDFRLVESAMRTGKLTEALFPSEQQLLTENLTDFKRLAASAGKTAAATVAAGVIVTALGSALPAAISGAAVTAGANAVTPALVQQALRAVISFGISEAIENDNISDYIVNLKERIKDKFDDIKNRSRIPTTTPLDFSTVESDVDSAISAANITEDKLNALAAAQLPSTVTVQITTGSNAAKLNTFMSSSLNISDAAEWEKVLKVVKRNLQRQAMRQGLSRRLKVESVSRETDRNLHPEVRWLELAGLSTEE